MVNEILRFTKVDAAFTNMRPLRYCPTFDTHSASLQYVARFHAKKVVKFKDAILTSYHRNEVIFFKIMTGHNMRLLGVIRRIIPCKEES